MKYTNSKIAGILFLTAMVASIAGGSLLEFERVDANGWAFKAGLILEIVNALSVLGIGVFLFSVIKKFHENAARVYLSLRILESVVCLAAPLVLVLFSSNSELRMFFTEKMIPLFFCCGALVLYSVLYVYRLLPQFISIWGFVGVAGIIVLNLANFETSTGMVLALPIILNEIFMGIWLIIKGFNKPKANVYAI